MVANEKSIALCIALNDQLWKIIVLRFEGKYDIRALVTFFKLVELLFQAIYLRLADPDPTDNFNAIEVTQGYFEHDAHLWFTAELEGADTTIDRCLANGSFLFMWPELK
jgi:hypothetical protein